MLYATLNDSGLDHIGKYFAMSKPMNSLQGIIL